MAKSKKRKIPSESIAAIWLPNLAVMDTLDAPTERRYRAKARRLLSKKVIRKKPA